MYETHKLPHSALKPTEAETEMLFFVSDSSVLQIEHPTVVVLFSSAGQK